MGSMTLGGSQSVIGALWDGLIVDNLGNLFGKSGFAKERKVWKKVAGISFCRDAYNANKNAMVYRNEVVGHGRDGSENERKYTAIEFLRQGTPIPENTRARLESEMIDLCDKAHFHSYDTF